LRMRLRGRIAACASQSIRDFPVSTAAQRAIQLPPFDNIRGRARSGHGFITGRHGVDGLERARLGRASTHDSRTNGPQDEIAWTPCRHEAAEAAMKGMLSSARAPSRLRRRTPGYMSSSTFADRSAGLWAGTGAGTGREKHTAAVRLRRAIVHAFTASAWKRRSCARAAPPITATDGRKSASSRARRSTRFAATRHC